MPPLESTDAPDQVPATTVLDDDRQYTIRELSGPSGIPERTIRAAIERGVIPVVQIPGCRRRRVLGRDWKKCVRKWTRR